MKLVTWRPKQQMFHFQSASRNSLDQIKQRKEHFASKIAYAATLPLVTRYVALPPSGKQKTGQKIPPWSE